MPLKAASPRRTSNHRRSAPVTPTGNDVNLTGLYDSNSVQDRIRQWQLQGAASAPAPDAVSVRSNPASEVGSTLERYMVEKDDSVGQENQGAKITPSKRRTSRWVDPENQEWVRGGRSSSTPRKRVISDEHWKSKESPRGARTQPSKKKEYTKRDEPCDTLSQNFRDTPSPGFPLSKEEREERRRRRREARKSRAAAETAKNDGGIQVYTIPSLSPKPSIHEDVKQDPGVPQRHKEYNSFSGRASPQTFQEADHDSTRFDEDDGRHWRKSKYAETLGRSTHDLNADANSSVGVVRSKKGKLFTKTKEIFSKGDTVPAASNRVPSIKAWLEEQPDPFVDGELEPQTSDVLIPAPLRTRPRRTKVSVETTIVETPNKIWECVEPKESSQIGSGSDRRRTRRSKPSLERGQESAPPVDSKNDVVSSTSANHENDPEESPGHLKRRGARKSKLASVAQDVKSARTVSCSPVLSTSPSKILEADGYDREEAPPPYRPCPQTGRHQLSTIVSVETFQARNNQVVAVEALPKTEDCGLKRKLTTHEDLMSVLSQPTAGKLKSARSMRRVRERVDKVSQQEILDDLVADESKYSRELRTLVDGVIPVLLQSVLSKTGSNAAARLFASSASASDDLAYTKPIIDMGIALERLKSTHNRIPTQDLDNLLSWAQSAHKAYKDYLTAWRLGFQDVVVNLAPLDETSVDQCMARDANGDVVDSNGKKADVAYLLKRPLVRIKDFSKTFNRIKKIYPCLRAEQVAEDYVDLTNLARRRSQEEQGRLEDEKAANIDATKARDLKTMAAVSGTVVDKSRRVKARDFFSMTLYHTTGQRIDCRIELVLRDNQPGLSSGGDVLICEVEDSGKWLFFPPVELKSISARKGEHPGDLVVMIRGHAGLKDWHELLSLKADDDEAAREWMSMLGSNPLPPKLNRSPSFIDRQHGALPLIANGTDISSFSQPPSLPDVDVPIGEPSLIGAVKARKHRGELLQPKYEKPRMNLGGGLRTEPINQYFQPKPRDLYRKSLPSGSTVSSGTSTFSAESTRNSSYNSSVLRSDILPEIKRTQVNRTTNGVQQHTSSISLDSPASSDHSYFASAQRKLSRTDNTSREWMSSPEIKREDNKQKESGSHSQHFASTPSQDLPTISKLKIRDQGGSSRPLNDSVGEKWAALSGAGKQSNSLPNTPGSRRQGQAIPFTEDIPVPPAHSLRPRDTSPKIGVHHPVGPPPPPPHRALQPSNGSVPALTAQPPSPSHEDKQRKRRSSSPLKHEYTPPTGSSSSDSYSDDSADASSETSEGEGGDLITPLVAVTAGGVHRASKPAQHGSVPTTYARTLAPSDSASQGPYRSVPAASAMPGAQKAKTVALLSTWSERGSWDSVGKPDELYSIVVSPGLIEAFDMSAAHSGAGEGVATENGSSESRTSSMTQHPVVAFELTPLVPLRRGTALDISIRSPPTANSKIKTTNNVMFRSRNASECEALYALINWARINNPTYIALERARPKRQPIVTFNTGVADNNRSRSGSWFGFGGQKKSSYRASSAPTPSVDISEASMNSMTSAFSALKRFRANSAFNLNRSSVVLKQGSGTGGSLYSSSSGTATGGSGSNSPAPSQMGVIPGKDGPTVPSTSAEAANGGGMVHNMKIRLYIREDLTKWVNLGAARLSVMPPPTPDGLAGAPGQMRPSPPQEGTAYHARPSPNGGQPELKSGPRLPSSNHTPHRIHGDGREKRIVVTANKEPDITFIDRVLGESCFERIMQSGIAVKIWEEDEIKKTGGVVAGRAKTYMLQFPGIKEASWVFGLCGTLRY